MDVCSISSLIALEKTIRPVERIAGEGSCSSAQSAEQDNVEMSNYGRSISRLYDLISAVPDIRESRVKEALLAIESGAYDNIKAEHIAEKLMRGNFLDDIF